MKVLKYTVLALFGLIALLLVGAAFTTNEFNYQQSIVLDAPVAKVWNNVNSLQAMEQWNPWMDKDPNVKRTFDGNPGEVGSSVSWQSELKEVGNGKQTIVAIVDQKLLTTDLKFYGDYESEAKAFVKLEDKNGKTEVTWGFESEMPYPFNAMMWFSSAEDMLGDDYRAGLNKLKRLVEGN